MDFRYSGPDCRGTNPKFHAGIDFVAKMTDDPKTSEPQEWRWWGSVCHRNPYDSCRSGRGICCTMSGVPTICRVGAMGWLLACQQAYVETIDLLYSNIFHVESTVLLRFFPQLVPAASLVSSDRPSTGFDPRAVRRPPGRDGPRSHRRLARFRPNHVGPRIGDVW
ncbi:uncharacterized protein LDX57_009748 [Aspergillus melleus]|uniref:uncharacterized protein n=1 Tax=Aspergillus melleus TaxID=138277 RepID=UPI001E8E7246|nr:uncharacterized protein LDX57_009748 [Aspergillus melleus]KAH8432102.1 hypothetical protein LDX57_009748 [Aspergillus melleus]